MLPILLLLIFAALEYGWMFVVQGQVVNAARQGLRLGIDPGRGNADIVTQADTVIANAGIGYSASDVTVTYPAGQADAGNVSGGTMLFVTVKVPYKSLTSFALLPMPGHLQATVAMAKEGP